jgi:hypothetical protein
MIFLRVFAGNSVALALENEDPVRIILEYPFVPEYGMDGLVKSVQIVLSPIFLGDALLRPDILSHRWIGYNFDATTGVMVINGARSFKDFEVVVPLIRFQTYSDNAETRYANFYWAKTEEPAEEDFILAYRTNITVQSTNDSPTFQNLALKSLYTVHQDPQLVASSISVKDDDSNVFLSARVAITSEYEIRADLLDLDITVPSVPWAIDSTGLYFVEFNGTNITALWDDIIGEIRFSGEGTGSTYEMVLRTVNFASTTMNPELPTRQISFVIEDSDAAETVACLKGERCYSSTDIVLVSRTVGFDLTVVSSTSSEAGGAGRINVKLLSQPTAPVLMSVSSTNSHEAIALPNFLVISETNWQTGEEVELVGKEDMYDDGDVSYKARCSVMITQDPDYTKILDSDADLINEDDPVNKIAVVVWAKDDACVTWENGTTWPIMVNLSYWSDAVIQPFQYVVVTVTSNQPTEGKVMDSASSILVEATGAAVLDLAPRVMSVVYFTADDWQETKVVPAIGVDDFGKDDGDQAYGLTFTAAVKKLGVDGLQPVLQKKITPLVSCINRDDDEPGLVIHFVDNGGVPCTTTTEAGKVCMIEVSLACEPTHEVRVDVLVTGMDGNPTTEAQVLEEDQTGADERQIRFTNENWDTPVIVEIQGLDDLEADGDQLYKYKIGPPISFDTNYKGCTTPAENADPTSFSCIPYVEYQMTNEDNDISQLEVLHHGSPLQSKNMRTDETGLEDEFTVNLFKQQQPTAPVTVTLMSDDTTECVLDTSTLIFTPTNFGSPQKVGITGIDDDILDGRQRPMISLKLTTTDVFYNDVIWSFYVWNDDDDGLELSAWSCVTSESDLSRNTGCTVSMRLPTWRPEMFKQVNVNVASTNTAEGVPNKELFIFTQETWNLYQNLTITGVDDSVADGNQFFNVTFISDLTYLLRAREPLGGGDVLPTYGRSSSGVKSIASFRMLVENRDDDTASLLVQQHGTTTSENGEMQSKFTVRVTSEPRDPVTVPIRSSRPEEGRTDISLIEFDSSNWRDEVNVTVLGMDDAIDDDDQLYKIVIGPSRTTDPPYNGLAFDLQFTNIDDDQYGMNVVILQKLSSEWGNVAEFKLGLKSEPVEPVLFSISSEDSTEGIADPSLLVVAGDNWERGVTVRVTGQPDDIHDGDADYNIQVAPMITQDPLYLSIGTTLVGFTNLDEPANLVEIYSNLLPTDVGAPADGCMIQTSEEGQAAAFFVRLNMWNGLLETDEQPFEYITVRVTAEQLVETEGLLQNGIRTGGNLVRDLLFTQDDWNIPREINFKGVDDDVVDGDAVFNVTLSGQVKTIGKVKLHEIPDYSLKPHKVYIENIDNDIAELSVELSDETPVPQTSETGDFVKFSVRLTSRPFGPVTIPSMSQDPTEGMVTSGQVITIQPDEWDQTFTIVVTGMDDLGCAEQLCPDGNAPYSISVGPSESSDPAYNGKSFNFDLTNNDNDIATLLIYQHGEKLTGFGAPVDETGSSTTFKIRLPKSPIAPTTVAVWVDDPEEAYLDKTEIAFTRTNFGTLQTITVTGIDDDEVGCGPLRVKTHRYGYQFTRGTGTERCDHNGNSRFAIQMNVSSIDPRYGGVSWKFDMYNNDDDVLQFCELVEINGTKKCGGPKTHCTTEEKGTTCEIGLQLSDAGSAYFSCERGTMEGTGLTGFNRHAADPAAENPMSLTEAITYCGSCCDNTDYTFVDVMNTDTGDAGKKFPGFEDMLNPLRKIKYLVDDETLAETKLRYYAYPDVASQDTNTGDYGFVWTVPDANGDIQLDADNRPIQVDLELLRTKMHEDYPGFTLVEYAISCNDDCKAATAIPLNANDQQGKSVCFYQSMCTTMTKFTQATVATTVTTDDEAEQIINPLQFVFDVNNFDQPIPLTFIGRDDSIDDGDYATSFVFDSSINYIHPTVDPLAVLEKQIAQGGVTSTNVDDDVALVVVQQEYEDDELGNRVGATIMYDTDEFGTRMYWLDIQLNSEPTEPVSIPVVPADANSLGEVAMIDFSCWEEERSQCYPACGCCGGSPRTCGWTCRCGIDVDNVYQKCMQEAKLKCNQLVKQLVFDATDWNQKKRVYLIGLDDDVVDYNMTYFISIGPSQSDDMKYSELVHTLNGTNRDDDHIGLTAEVICTDEGLPPGSDCVWMNRTSEDGAYEGMLQMRLKSEPKSTVLFTVSSSMPGEATVSPQIIAFTVENWKDYQVVTVRGLDDPYIDGNRDYKVNLKTLFTTDPDYKLAMLQKTLGLTNLDEETDRYQHECPRGFYGIQPECVPCQQGLYSDTTKNATTAWACKLCAVGLYGQGEGSPSKFKGCFPCPEGKYNDLRGAVLCKDCHEKKTCPVGSMTPIETNLTTLVTKVKHHWTLLEQVHSPHCMYSTSFTHIPSPPSHLIHCSSLPSHLAYVPTTSIGRVRRGMAHRWYQAERDRAAADHALHRLLHRSYDHLLRQCHRLLRQAQVHFSSPLAPSEGTASQRGPV